MKLSTCHGLSLKGSGVWGTTLGSCDRQNHTPFSEDTHTVATTHNFLCYTARGAKIVEGIKDADQLILSWGEYFGVSGGPAIVPRMLTIEKGL